MRYECASNGEQKDWPFVKVVLDPGADSVGGGLGGTCSPCPPTSVCPPRLPLLDPPLRPYLLEHASISLHPGKYLRHYNCVKVTPIVKLINSREEKG